MGRHPGRSRCLCDLHTWLLSLSQGNSTLKAAWRKRSAYTWSFNPNSRFPRKTAFHRRRVKPKKGQMNSLSGAFGIQWLHSDVDWWRPTWPPSRSWKAAFVLLSQLIRECARSKYSFFGVEGVWFKSSPRWWRTVISLFLRDVHALKASLPPASTNYSLPPVSALDVSLLPRFLRPTLTSPIHSRDQNILVGWRKWLFLCISAVDSLVRSRKRMQRVKGTACVEAFPLFPPRHRQKQLWACGGHRHHQLCGRICKHLSIWSSLLPCRLTDLIVFALISHCPSSESSRTIIC